MIYKGGIGGAVLAWRSVIVGMDCVYFSVAIRHVYPLFKNAKYLNKVVMHVLVLLDEQRDQRTDPGQVISTPIKSLVSR
jgi:hypothetical protein